jgi:hypothetical protein
VGRGRKPKIRPITHIIIIILYFLSSAHIVPFSLFPASDIIYYYIQPPYGDYNPIEDALPLWDHKTRPTCTGQACRASTFSTQTAWWRVFILPDLQLYGYLEACLTISKKKNIRETKQQQRDKKLKYEF